MTPQELIDLPGYENAQHHVIMQKDWDYDYPAWFLEQVENITVTNLTEHQRNELIGVYNGILEGYP